MLKEMRDMIGRADGLVADAAGAVSLMVILFAGLHLPMLF